MQMNFGGSSYWGSIANDSNSFCLRIKFTSSYLDQSFSSCQRLWVVLKVDCCQLHSKNFALQGIDDDFWMRLHYFNCVFKVYGAVTFDLKLLVVVPSNNASFAHINCTGEQLSLL